MPQTQSIQSLVDTFVSDLELLTKRSALEQVLAALGGSAPTKRGRKPGRKPGRPAGKSKIDPDQLLIHVKKNPGQRGEQIAAALRSDVKAIRPTMLKLIASKKVKTKGQRRGMTYEAR